MPHGSAGAEPDAREAKQWQPTAAYGGYLAATLGSSRKALPASPASRRIAVTLQQLIAVGVIQPGGGVLRADYKHQRDIADLLPDGRIRQGALVFESPSAFSVYSKRKVTPDRKSDDGWKSIKYGELPLEHYKQLYLDALGAEETPSPAWESTRAGSPPHVPMSVATGVPATSGASAASPGRSARLPGTPPPLPWSPAGQAGPGADAAAVSAASPWSPGAGDDEDALLRKRPRLVVKLGSRVAANPASAPGPQQVPGKCPAEAHEPFSAQQRALLHARTPQYPELLHGPELDLPFYRASLPPGVLLRTREHLDAITAAMLYAPRLPLSLPLSAPLFRIADAGRRAAPWEPEALVAAEGIAGDGGGAMALSGGGSRPRLWPSASPVALPAPCLVQPKLPPIPRKQKTVAASQPPRPKALPSTTYVSAEPSRSRRDMRTPHRSNGVNTLSHQMLDLESYSRPAGEAGGDAQPFSIRVHPRALLAMDVHAHLCQHEIIGVFGGHYDSAARCLTVLCARPVREGMLVAGKIDVEMDPADQHRAMEELQREGLQCVGWYHSHPTFPVLPSTIDVYNQHTQQVAHQQDLAPGAAAPYVAAIVGPYDSSNASPQSHMSWFYVENRRSEEYTLDLAPEECLQYMVPKLLTTSLIEAEEVSGLAAAARVDALPLIRQYADYDARTDFTQFWRPDLTNLQKMVSSIWHTMRAYVTHDDLRDLGTELTQTVWRHFYESKHFMAE